MIAVSTANSQSISQREIHLPLDMRGKEAITRDNEDDT